MLVPCNRWLTFAFAITVTACAGSLSFLGPDIRTYLYTKRLEAELQRLVPPRTLLEMEDADGWDVTRLTSSSSQSGVSLVRSLTTSVLRAPGKIALDPLVLTKKDKSHCLIVVHLGQELGGPDGLVHGAQLAKLWDEAMEKMVSDL